MRKRIAGHHIASVVVEMLQRYIAYPDHYGKEGPRAGRVDQTLFEMFVSLSQRLYIRKFHIQSLFGCKDQ